jgi:SsrA-binding protein
MSNKINIKNKKAAFNFELIEKYIAGIQLLGTEIKSVRQGKASLADAYCFFKNGELHIKNMYIAEYSHGNLNNHDPNRDRKLLLNKRELFKLDKKVKEKGLSIIVTRLFIQENKWAKLEIALAKGKQSQDKREDIKRREAKIEMGRMQKHSY